ncbi:MAG: SurA N-terminal domain-containing protein [Porticoccaceae bacterium]
MLQSFRDNIKGFTAIFLIGLLTIPFAFVGVDSLFMSGSAAETALVVNGESISELKVQRAIAGERNAILQANPGLDVELLEDQLLRPRAEQQLIAAALLGQAARESGMAVTPKAIAQQLSQIEAFQSNGQFDSDRYRYVIQNQGYTSKEFKNTLAEDLLNQQLTSGFLNSAFVTGQEIEELAEIIEQQRDYYYLTLSAQQSAAAVEVESTEVEAYYTENAAQFTQPEQVSIEYIELSLAATSAAVELDAEQVAQRLAQLNEEQGSASEQRNAAHILLEDPSVELLAELSDRLAGGEDFAELAADYSVDFVSANSGGELGFTDGTAFPEAFEQALTELAVGEVSAPVKTDAGTHFIKLLGVDSVEVDSEQQRREVERTMRLELAQSQLASDLAALKELSFNAETLADVADQLGLSVQTSAAFSRSGGPGIAAEPAVITAAFSDDVKVDGFASEVIELDDDRYTVIKIVDMLPAATLPLADVVGEIEQQLRQELVSQQLQQRAMAYIAELEQDANIEQLAKRDQLSWQVVKAATMAEPQVQREVLERVFALPNPQNEGSFAIQSLSSGDVAVISLRNVELGDAKRLSAERRAAIRSGLLQSELLAELGGYQGSLMESAELKR